MALTIGIPVPTSTDIAYNRQCWPQYAAAVSAAGALAESLELGLAHDAFAAKMEACDGFVLPGSPADVEPASYGQVRGPATAAADAPREECDRCILQHAAATGKPVLAICFGVQLLNVFCEGTLVQDLPPVPVNHAAGPQVGVAHSVVVAPQSLLASLLSAAEAPATVEGRRFAVNSSHHQALLAVRPPLVVVARAVEDGTIEAVEGRLGEAAVLGVQWHPERSTGISAASRNLFSWLIAEAEDRAGSHTLVGEHGARL